MSGKIMQTVSGQHAQISAMFDDLGRDALQILAQDACDIEEDLGALAG